MEEKDFNELLFEEKKNPKNIKNIILGAIGVVVILIIVLLIWSFGKNSHDTIEHSETIQPEQITENTKTPETIEDDRFEQIRQSIENKTKNETNITSSDQDTLAIQDENHQNMTQEDAMQPSQEITSDEQLHAALSLNNESKEQEDAMQQQDLSSQELIPQTKAISNTQEIAPQTKEEKKQIIKQTKEQNQSTKQTKAKKTTKSNIATKGSYLQVGVFSKKPSKELMAMLKKHSYRTQEININGQKLTKYLVGPFKSRSEASRYKEAHHELDFSVYFEVK